MYLCITFTHTHTHNMKPLFFEKELEALAAAAALDMNVLFYGPPGHNKSGGVEWFYYNVLGLKKEQVFIKSISSGTDIDELLGGTDIAKMRADGTPHYRLSSPDFFGNYEYVIFEELFDAREKTLAALKDILTAKEVRLGGQRYPIKTKMIVANTNVSATEFASNWERAAIIDRFPIAIEVRWDEYTPEAFVYFAKHILGANDYSKIQNFVKVAAYRTAETYEMDREPISPRRFAQAVRAVAKTNNPKHGWLILGVTEGAFSPDKEMIFRFRIQTIANQIKRNAEVGDVSGSDKILSNLRKYLQEADKTEKELLKVVISDCSEYLYQKLAI